MINLPSYMCFILSPVCIKENYSFDKTNNGLVMALYCKLLRVPYFPNFYFPKQIASSAFLSHDFTLLYSVNEDFVFSALFTICDLTIK